MRKTRNTMVPCRGPRGGGVGAGGRRGFTLMEMMVVIGLVALMATMALPSIVSLFNSGADAQAYNLIAAQLTAARALAIEKSTYAGVHVQMADMRARPELKSEACFSALVLYNPRERYFELYDQPRRTPGSMAFGKVTGTYDNTAKTLYEFTSFTVAFSSAGSAVRQIEGETIRFNPQDPAFDPDDHVDANDIAGSRRLWEWDRTGGTDGRRGVIALCIFDLGQYLPRADGKRVQYLKDNARFLPLNVHTGQLFPRE